MASKLPLDVLQIIFTFIRKSEKKKLKAIGNLHSCLLVNRQWCEATIPLLWRNSFYYFEKGNEKLIDVYISCFNEKERTELEEQGIKLSFTNINNSLPTPTSPPPSPPPSLSSSRS